MTTKNALKAYILFNLNAHNLILNYLEKIINLPSIDNDSHNAIDMQSNDIMKVYFLNGYLKHKFIKFYDRYILEINYIIEDYCKKIKVDIDEEDIGIIKELVISAKITKEKIIQNLNNNIKNSLSDKELLTLIRQVHSTSNIMINLEYKMRSLIDLDDLDIQKGMFFKSFRYNPLYDKTKDIFYDFPAAVKYNMCINYFTYTYENLIDKLEPDNE